MGNMKITPTSLSISQLLSTESEQFTIPAYQRRYSWQDKQVKELFDDINHLEGGETHLLGSIVCLTGDHGAGINALELVDGQQRTARSPDGLGGAFARIGGWLAAHDYYHAIP